jgi:hypothetical protein
MVGAIVLSANLIQTIVCLRMGPLEDVSWKGSFTRMVHLQDNDAEQATTTFSGMTGAQ